MATIPTAAPGAGDWSPTPSGDAPLKLSTNLSGRVPILRMDYGFREEGGFVVARRAFSRTMYPGITKS